MALKPKLKIPPENLAAARGEWKPGMLSPNPSGRPVGIVGGRGKALRVLDQMMGEDENVARLREFLQKEFDEDPCRFFRTYVLPFLPKDRTIHLDKHPLAVEIRMVTNPSPSDAIIEEEQKLIPGREGEVSS